MWISTEWEDYKIIHASKGEKTEKWGNIILRRPDPQILWEDPKHEKPAHAIYKRSKSGGGFWEFKDTPQSWSIKYKQFTFKVKPMNFKHTGIFPEQAVNWEFLMNNVNSGMKILNLFSYTGCSTVVCASKAREVCHVDAARGMVDMAKTNLKLSNLEDAKVRFLVDDVFKFVEREIRRKNKYDAIIMDPPSYGRGPNGEVFKIEAEIFKLINACQMLLSDNPAFFLINSYTAALTPLTLKNILNLTLVKTRGGLVESEEIGLPIEGTQLVLPCGITARWVRH